MHPTSQRTFEVAGPLDLARTVAGTAMWGGNSWIRTDPGVAWYARHTEDGPATVHLVQRDAVVHATAWGPGAARLLDRVPALIGLHDNPEPLVPVHKGLARVLHRHPGLRLGRTDTLYEGLMRAAMAAGAGKREGKQAMWRMAAAWGTPAPGPRDDLTLFPRPRELARRTYPEFHPVGLSRLRAQLIQVLCRKAAYVAQAAELPASEVDAHLQALPGVGPWVSAVTRSTVLGDPDAVPVGDPNLPNMVAFTLVGEPRATTERMLELLAPYEGQRGRVVRLAKAVGPKPPRRGPKPAVRDIRHR